MTINICNDFSETPGARYRAEGEYSGEEFRETILVPAFERAIQCNEKIIIELDGGYGYPTSFLEEAFGGLARKYTPEQVDGLLSFVSDDEPSLEGEIREYIANANNKKRRPGDEK